MKAVIIAVCLLSSSAWAQTFSSVPLILPPQGQPSAAAPTQPEQSSYANYSIMLVNPAGGAVVLMHNPKNGLEYVDVTKTKEAFAAGYVPFRTAEISELLMGLDQEVIRLREENARLRKAQPTQAAIPSLRSQTELEAQQRAQAEEQQRAQAATEKAARRQQLLQAWMMLQTTRPAFQSMPLPVPMQVAPSRANPNINCTTQHIGNTSYTNCN